jgi:hypothetical protein
VMAWCLSGRDFSAGRHPGSGRRLGSGKRLASDFTEVERSGEVVSVMLPPIWPLIKLDRPV